MDLGGFDRTFLCEEPIALSKCELSFAAQMSESEYSGTETPCPDGLVIRRPSEKPKIQKQQNLFRIERKQKALALKHLTQLSQK
jgi:hypothetical protein